MKKAVILTLIISAYFCSCKNNEEGPRIGGAVWYQSFIQEYREVNKMEHRQDIEQKKLLWISFRGEQYGGTADFGKNGLGDSLHLKYADTSYRSYGADLIDRIAICDDFTSIDLVSDRDFDKAHPAGTSLGDIVRFYGGRYYDFIKNKYVAQNPLTEEDVELWKEIGIELREGVAYRDAPIAKTLDKIGGTDLFLLRDFFRLFFITTPPAGVHNMTLTLAREGKQVDYTFKVEM